MALQLIIGRAGAGKSYNMYNNMIQASLNATKENFIAVVPEQYSMETQKEIMTLHPNHGSFNIEVTSFIRLAYTVFEEQGFSGFQVMDDLGKTLVMRKILEECKEELVLYKKKVSMPGFAEKMKTVISELKQYGVSNDVLEEMKETTADRPILQQKLKDISTISHAFESFIQEKMITPEDILYILCDNIPQSKWIENTSFYFDGYTGFTPAQYKVLDLLINYAKNVTVAVTLPEDEADFATWDNYELFALSKETISKLRQLAKKNHVTECPIIVAGQNNVPYRIKESEKLCHIESNIFRNKPVKKIDNSCEAVEIYATANPHKEAQLVARKIAKLVISNKYRYNEIAVVTGDMSSYYRFLEEEFTKCNIPAFIDHKREITSNPYVDGIIAALEIIEKDFSYDTVFHFLKLGIVDIDNYSLDIFENYVIRTGRKGYKSYCQKWDKTFKDMPEDYLDLINKVRNEFVTIIEPLRQQLKEKNITIETISKAIYQMILDLKYQNQLENCVSYFNNHNMAGKAKEYGQIYGEIIQLLDKLVILMGTEKISLSEYKQILLAGFENIKVGIIPPGLDMVMVGDLERTRLKDTKKIIFIMGVNDGVIPKAGSTNGVITDADREFLEQHNFLLAPTAKDNVFKQKLYLYSLLAKPTEKIVFTFSKMANNMDALRKSYLIDDIQRLFNDLVIKEDEEEITEVGEIINKTLAARYIAENFINYRWHKEDKLFEYLNVVLLNDEKFAKTVELMARAAYYKINNPILDKANAIKLYGAKDNIKVTTLEKYAKCPFSQFAEIGLRLKNRPQHTLEAYDLGNLYHGAIDTFFKDVRDKQIDWKNIATDQCHEIIDEAIEKVMAEYENDALESSARNRFLKKQVKEITTQVVDVLIDHVKAGKFLPETYELNLRSGRVDRVDLLEHLDKLYVKVIDYKSGNKTFSLDRVYEGIDLQLMMYLKECVEYYSEKYPNKEVIPAGAFYFRIHNPYVDAPDFDRVIEQCKEGHFDSDKSIDEIKRLIVDEERKGLYKMPGLVDSDLEIIKLMDKNMETETDSKILPVSIKKDGQLSAKSNVVNSKLYGALLEHVSQLTDKYREEIVNGKIDVSPIEGNCDYCIYSGICGFDTKLGYKHRKVGKHSIDEIKDELLGD